MTPLLKTEGLTVTFGGLNAIDGVEATEGDGQAFGLEKGGHVISLPTMSGWVTCPRRSVV